MGEIIDFVESTLSTIEQISNVAARRPATRRSPAPASTGPARRSPAGRVDVRPPTQATQTRAEFSVVDAIDADTGRPVFVVRNARGDSATCSSLAFAQRVRDSLG